MGRLFPARIAPYAIIPILYLVTVLFSAEIILTPISIVAAQEFNNDPRPFIIAIFYGASTCFMTPIGYQINLMVFGSGRYRFLDFIKTGLPLNFIFWILATIFIPVIWPF